ncbi:calcium/sodium antiporter [bacterium]|uniref:calcium/sodium antiporter n=1 Tax=Lachnospiraceae TaxID=186803 RepID=UPI002A8533EB|nr:calcium/sodium antiporter [bacterium]MDD7144399.1 calcium/sodium antiporter [bacterium]MDY4195179.1 calcium/sodium antiporter [Bariatricus sp.]MDY4504564.1 calcium/sodium antiporter [Bariatricus sp.]MDY5458335.1 calcium/sodium antiporter [Bariatricus sp.]
MVYVLLILGFVLLIKGADYFVEGSSSVAKLLKVPAIIIGLTVVAFGTSMPEASVSITAALKGQNSLAVSNVLGSNMFNLLIVLGCSALMRPLRATDSVLKKEFPFSIFITAAMLLMTTKLAFGKILAGEGEFVLGRISGVVLLIMFVLFLVLQVKEALKARNAMPAEDYAVLSPAKSAIFIIGGIAGIVLGGDLVVDSATEIAVRFGLSQTFIGLTIVAMGTSLPELVTSMVAAKKGENDLALGNVVGSNIFNILLILGSSSAICPITVDIDAIYDMIILIVFSVFALICAKSRKELSKREGVLFLMLYAVYFAYIYVR